MEILNQPARVPDWEDINDIIKHLQFVLDTLEESDEHFTIRARIARTIANMRAEKSIEQAIDRLFTSINEFDDSSEMENLILYHEPPFLGIA
ncbi:hypothetical protein GF325_13820 [Candidatus Bathyarchaeota archaeon]|nr:hypothetical protein [Candidatus Bathyarchaeota archaeon]